MRLSSPALFSSAVHCSLPYFSATNRSISPNTTPCIVHLRCPGRIVLCIGKLRVCSTVHHAAQFSDGNTGRLCAVCWWLYVCRAMPVESDRRQPLRKHNANRYENGSRSWRERHRHFCPCAFRILIPAAKAEPALRQVFANRDFFLKSPPSNASEHARLHAILFPMRIHPLFRRRHLWRHPVLLRCRLRLNPNRWRIAMGAQPRHAFTHFK